MAKRLQMSRQVCRSCAMGAFLGGIGFTAYMIWIGVTGQPVPLWFIALATVF
ncbi:MAG: hypothetical protein L0H63_12570 [Nitrococcus sp.]|nr:hypothetical protein [Nitrococcus sp.]